MKDVNKMNISERIQLAGLLLLYIFADTLLGGIVGVLGYLLLSIIKVNIIIRKLFLFWMILLGFAIGIFFAVRYYKTVLRKFKSKT